jgi:HSP20 family molecular chaperone IbpA
MDLPGMEREEVTVSRNNVTTIVKGTRNKNSIETSYAITDYEKNELKFGDFTLTFKIPEEYERKWENIELLDGVLCVKYKKDSDEVDINPIEEFGNKGT